MQVISREQPRDSYDQRLTPLFRSHLCGALSSCGALAQALLDILTPKQTLPGRRLSSHDQAAAARDLTNAIGCHVEALGDFSSRKETLAHGQLRMAYGMRVCLVAECYLRSIITTPVGRCRRSASMTRL